METSTLIDAYIDVNILLVSSLGLWFVAQRFLAALGLHHAHTTQLRLLSGVFLATILSPVLAAIISTIAATGPFATSFSVNLSDFVTAQYLNGSFEMAPSAFEDALGFRSQVISGVQYLDTRLGVAAVVFMTSSFIFAALRLAFGFQSLSRIVSASTIWRQFGSLELRVSDTVSIPFSTRTLWRHIVVVPSSILENPRDLKVALGHEFQHLRQRDLEWEIALELLRPFFFWNPAFTIWKRKFEMLRELSCDQNVLVRHAIAPGDYCKSLLRICENNFRPKRLFEVEVPRVAMAETRSVKFSRSPATLLQRRLESLLDDNPERRPRTVFALAFVPLLVITLVSTMAIQQPGDWSYDRIMLSTIVNLDRLAARSGSPVVQLEKNQ